VQELGPPELGRHDLVQLSEGVLAADEEVDGEALAEIRECVDALGSTVVPPPAAGNARTGRLARTFG
jgi:hypothetical protein